MRHLPAALTSGSIRLNEWRSTAHVTRAWVNTGNSRDPSALLVGGFNRFTGILTLLSAYPKACAGQNYL